MRTRKVVLIAVGLKGIVIFIVAVLAVYMQPAVSQFWFSLMTPKAIREKLELAQKNNELPNLNEKDSEGRTGLIFAVDNHDVELVKTLLAFKADPNIRDAGIYEGTTGNTALHRAIYHGDTSDSLVIIAELLKAGADPRMANDQGLTPVHLTSWITDSLASSGTSESNRRTQILTLLVAAGADLNAVDNSGNTLLHLLVQKHDSSGIKNIIDAFPSLINRNVKNNEGLTALDLCYQLFQPVPYDLPQAFGVTIPGRSAND